MNALAIDLGSLANAFTLHLSAKISITTASAGSGFDFGLIFGDPPPLTAAEPAIAASAGGGVTERLSSDALHTHLAGVGGGDFSLDAWNHSSVDAHGHMVMI